MKWKCIGQSVIGSSHVIMNKGCEDAVSFRVMPFEEEEVLICCVSDGAGSAKYARWASNYITSATVNILGSMITGNRLIIEEDIIDLAEQLYDGISAEAEKQEVDIYEFSATFLGCIIYPGRAIFFHVGDGAIVRNDGNDFYTTLWWPQNGEYQNTTFFLVSDENFSMLQIRIIEDSINEIAIFSDGLQQLALNFENQDVHQPFFSGMFRSLRMADDESKIDILDKKLSEYLNSEIINKRTDDDKTLFLATKLNG